MGNLNSEVSITFHVAFSLIDDKRVATTPTLCILHDSNPFDCSEHFEFSAEVTLRCVLVLWVTISKGFCIHSEVKTHESGNEECFVRVSDCLRIFLRFV